MSSGPHFSRRRALQTLFFSSAALSLNLRPAAHAQSAAAGGLNFLCIGDFGTGGSEQKSVAAAMKNYASTKGLKTDGIICIGDNFYSADKNKGGFSADSPRWKKEIEDMYPASAFPGPIYAVLGNHDYHDNAKWKGQNVQLAYAQKPGVRWTMPAKWYRKDLGSVLTLLCLDSNLPSVSGGKGTRPSLTQQEEQDQMEWLKAELKKPRAPFTLVVAHHPVYSNGSHGDTKPLVAQWDGLFQEHKVHAYLCGHDHDLQHLELEGKFTSHVLSGGGGARVRKLVDTHKVPFGLSVYGFTHLQVTAESMRFTHLDTQGQPLHTFEKKPDGSVALG